MEVIKAEIEALKAYMLDQATPARLKTALWVTAQGILNLYDTLSAAYKDDEKQLAEYFLIDVFNSGAEYFGLTANDHNTPDWAHDFAVEIADKMGEINAKLLDAYC